MFKIRNLSLLLIYTTDFSFNAVTDLTLCRSGLSVTDGQVMCVARDMVKRQASESSDAGKSEVGSSHS